MHKTGEIWLAQHDQIRTLDGVRLVKRLGVRRAFANCKVLRQVLCQAELPREEACKILKYAFAIRVVPGTGGGGPAMTG